MAHDKIGIARFKGFARLAGDEKWDLNHLLENLDQAIIEVEAENIQGFDPWLYKFRWAHVAISDLIKADGNFEDVVEGEPAPPPLLAEWEIFGDVLALPRLEGLSFGHPELIGRGRPICTSLLLYIDTDQGFARTLSRYYRLGKKRGERHDA